MLVLTATEGFTLAEATTLVGSYLLGSVPFGLLLGFLVGRVDIRTVGSGNIGATNVARALGRPWALLAFGLDFAKGWVPAYLLAPLLASADERVPLLQVLGGGLAVAGHCWPVYLRFRGGKGVATGCGVVVGVDPLVFLVGGVAWLVTLGLTRYVGLSSMVMGASFPVAAWWRTGDRVLVAGALALTVLVFVRHRANIGRMFAGTEPKVGGARAPRSG